MDEGLFGRMFRGQCNPQTQSAKATLGRCSRINNSNVISMDMDGRKIDVVIVDAPECSNQRSGHSTASLKPNKKCFPSRVVIIDEENGNYFGFRDADQSTMPSKTCHFSSGSHFPEESDSDECQVLKGKVRVDSPRWMFNASVADSDSDSDSDCEIMDDLSGNIRKEWEKAYLMKKRVMNNARSKKGSGVFESHNEHGVHSETSREKVNSVNTSGDTCLSPRKEETSETPANGEADLQVPCAADDFTGQTSLDSTRMHNDGIVDHSVGEASNLASGSQNKSEPFSKSMCGTKARPMRSFGHKVTSNSCGHDSPVRKCFPCNTTTEHGLNGHSNVDSMADGGNASMSMSDVQDKHQDGDVLGCRNSSPCDNDHLSSSEPRSRKVTRTSVSLEPNSNLGEPLTDARSACSFKGKDSSQGTLQSIIKGMNPGVVEQSSLGMMDGMSDFQSDIIGERDKHKQSEGYRLAEEEEWASRRQQIKIQAEEAQRLRKRKKAQTLRLLDMERRQKQRVEEIRESQKRDEETIDLKDNLRAMVRKELESLELKHRDMASLLRALGIHVRGGSYPMSGEVNAAFKQALFRFHPDRASRTDIREQVEAEEKFKLISRLKQRLLPVAY